MAGKPCFGKLDEVFPMGTEGLREVVPTCFGCPDKTACLRAALATEQGLTLRKEAIDRSEPRGFVDRIRRWSERKALSRQIDERKKGQT
jgi:hypothetical protein